MERDFNSLTPSELNSVLKKACGRGLFLFADAIRSVASLVEVDRDGDRIEIRWGEGIVNTAKERLRLCKRLATLRKRCIEDALDVLCAEHRHEFPARKAYYKGKKEAGVDFIFEAYPALRRFCAFLDEKKTTIGDRYAHIQQRKGAPINKINLLFAYWGFIWTRYPIRQPGRCSRIDWDLLVDLFQWFWARIGEHNAYKSLKPKSQDQVQDPDYLKNQFYKNKLRNSKIFVRSRYLPARGGYLLWLGKFRAYDYSWEELRKMDVAKMKYDNHHDDKKKAIETLRKLQGAKDWFREAVMLPDLSCVID